MESSHNNIQIQNLKIEFDNIIKLYNDVNIKKTEIEIKIQKLKEIYNDLVRKNTNKESLFSLDSLFFQYKILNLDLEHYNKKVALIQNRMYGDYYKLYTILCSSTISASTKEDNNKPMTSFAVYKDIDPFFKYKLEDIIAVHDGILDHIRELLKECDTKMENIQYHRNHVSVGMSLLIFINTLEHERNMLEGQISLYINYLEFYHKTQTKYLKCIYQGISDFYINLEETVLLCMSEGACDDMPSTIEELESILSNKEHNNREPEEKFDDASSQDESIVLDNLKELGVVSDIAQYGSQDNCPTSDVAVENITMELNCRRFGMRQSPITSSPVMTLEDENGTPLSVPFVIFNGLKQEENTNNTDSGTIDDTISNDNV